RSQRVRISCAISRGCQGWKRKASAGNCTSMVRTSCAAVVMLEASDILLWNVVSRQISPDRLLPSSTEASASSRHVRRGLPAFGRQERGGLPAFGGQAPRPLYPSRSATRPRLAAKPLANADDGRPSVEELLSLASSTRSKHCCSRAESGNHPSVRASS